MSAPANPASRPCPFCAGNAGGLAHPGRSRYAGESFAYSHCGRCGLVYIDPLPSPALLDKLYAGGDYHEAFYADEGQSSYAETADRLARHLPPGARVLDFGCGTGHLIAELRARGFAAAGVEFSAERAAAAEARSGCPVFPASDPVWQTAGQWDCIHLGDVIEHLGEPRETLRQCLADLAPSGMISAEGPLERNRSLVFYATALFACAKRWRDPSFVPEFPPYHLLFADAASQRRFFAGLPGASEVLWDVHESGWPYRGNGAVRDVIARASIALSRLPGLRGRWGNRFAALYRLSAG